MTEYKTLQKLGFSIYSHKDNIIKYYPTIRIEKIKKILKQI